MYRRELEDYPNVNDQLSGGLEDWYFFVLGFFIVTTNLIL
jgi:hypothetical protein